MYEKYKTGECTPRKKHREICEIVQKYFTKYFMKYPFESPESRCFRVPHCRLNKSLGLTFLAHSVFARFEKWHLVQSRGTDSPYPPYCLNGIVLRQNRWKLSWKTPTVPVDKDKCIFIHS